MSVTQTCKVEGCDNIGRLYQNGSRSLAKGMCNKHYLKYKKYGDPLYTIVKHHGLSKRPEYKTWCDIKDRCYNDKRSDYKNYGGRGIAMCDRWLHSFERFFEDMGGRPSELHSIDRIDNSKGYSPENCRWATRSEQNRNRRKPVTNKTGLVGIHKRGNSWRVKIGRMYIGSYLDLNNAIQARKRAESKYWGLTP